MAVTHIHEIWKGRGADGKVDETTYVRVFRAWTNSGFDGGATVGAALQASVYAVGPGSVYPEDARAFCVGVTPNNDLGPMGWLLTATYSTKKEYAAQPQDDPFEIEWDEEDIEVPIIKDRDGKAVLNSAGDPPDPPLMGADSILVATVTLKAATLPAYLRAYRKSINSAAFTIDGITVNAKHGRIRKIRLGKSRYRASYPYRDVTIEIAILDNDEDDWEIRWIDAGFRKRVEYPAASGDYIMEKIVNSDMTEPSSPVPLDGSGLPLVDPDPDNVIINETKWYRLKTFGGNIPGCDVV